MTVIRITDAPEAYDGFGTVELTPWKFESRRARSYRKVQIQNEHLDWQRNRYSSGLYVCLPEETFAEWAADGLA